MCATQCYLPIETQIQNYSESDFFVSECNAEAYRMICKVDPARWPNKRLLLIGEAGSGKKHLAKIWLNKCPDRMLFNIDQDFDVEDFIDKVESSSGVVCNLGSGLISKEAEKDLFTIFNFTTELGIPLVITSTNIYGILLPDLKSRVSATYVIRIGWPSEEMIRVLVHKYMSDMQIALKSAVVEYIVARGIEGGFGAVRSIVNEINANLLNCKDMGVKSMLNMLTKLK